MFHLFFVSPYTFSRPKGAEREGGRARSASKLGRSEAVTGDEASSQTGTGPRDDVRGGDGKPAKKSAPKWSCFLHPVVLAPVQFLLVVSLFGDCHNRKRRGRGDSAARWAGYSKPLSRLLWLVAVSSTASLTFFSENAVWSHLDGVGWSHTLAIFLPSVA